MAVTISEQKVLRNGMSHNRTGDAVSIGEEATLILRAQSDDPIGITQIQFWCRRYPYNGEQFVATDFELVSGDGHDGYWSYTFKVPALYESGNPVETGVDTGYFNLRPYENGVAGSIGNTYIFDVGAEEKGYSYITGSSPDGYKEKVSGTIKFELGADTVNDRSLNETGSLYAGIKDDATDTLVNGGWDVADTGVGEAKGIYEVSFDTTTVADGLYYMDILFWDNIASIWMIRKVFFDVDNTNNQLSGNTYSNGYHHRKEITIPSANISGTGIISDFVVPIEIESTDLKGIHYGGKVVSSGGYDIRFEDDAGNKLSHHIEKYTHWQGKLLAWVKVSSLDTQSDNTIYIYFGKSGVASSEEDKLGTWSAFTAVWLLDEAGTAQFRDAKGVYDMSTVGNELLSTVHDGKFTRGLRRSDDSTALARAITDSAISLGGGDMTILFWARLLSSSQNGNAQLIWEESGGRFRHYTTGNNTFRWRTYNDSSTAKTGIGHVLNVDQWEHISMRISSGSGRDSYLDGAVVETDATATIQMATNDKVALLSSGTVGQDTYADISHIMIANTDLGDDYIANMHTSQNSPTTFSTVGVTEDAPSPEYDYKRVLTIDHTKVASTETDFPVWVHLTENYLKTVANGGKVKYNTELDIKFEQSGTKLAHEVVGYNVSTGELKAWVKIPSISSTVDTTFELHYGKSIAVAEDTPTQVWTKFEAVWHLENSPTVNITDSTGNGYTMESFGSMTISDMTDINGVPAFDFDGVDDYLRTLTTHNTYAGSSGEIAWVSFLVSMPSNVVGSKQPMIFKEHFGVFSVDGELSIQSNGDNSGWSAATSIDDATNHAVHTLYNQGNEYKIYVDGSQALQKDTTDVEASNTYIQIAESVGAGAGRFFPGKIGHVKWAKQDLGAGWAQTEYNNQLGNGFYTVGAEQTTLTTGTQTATAVGNLVLPTSYANGYEFRKEITLLASQLSGVSTITGQYLFLDIPFDTSKMYNTMIDYGYVDFIITDGLGVEIPYNKVYEKVDSVGVIIKLDLDPTVDTTLYIYYGNDSETTIQEDNTSVWSDVEFANNFNSIEPIFPPNEAWNSEKGSYFTVDSSTRTVVSNTLLGSALQTNGSNIQSVSVPGVTSYTNLTYHFRFASVNVDPTQYGRITELWVSGGDGFRYFVIQGTSPNWDMAWDANDGSFNRLLAPINDTSWHNATITYDGTTQRYYIDGVEVASSVDSFNFAALAGSLILGGGGSNLYQTAFKFDQVIIGDLVWSPDFIANYHKSTDEVNSDTIRTIGPEETAVVSFTTIDQTVTAKASLLNEGVKSLTAKALIEEGITRPFNYGKGATNFFTYTLDSATKVAAMRFVAPYEITASKIDLVFDELLNPPQLKIELFSESVVGGESIGEPGTLLRTATFTPTTQNDWVEINIVDTVLSGNTPYWILVSVDSGTVGASNYARIITSEGSKQTVYPYNMKEGGLTTGFSADSGMTWNINRDEGGGVWVINNQIGQPFAKDYATGAIYGSQRYRGQMFTLDEDLSINSISLYLRKVGTPTGTVQLVLEEDGVAVETLDLVQADNVSASGFQQVTGKLPTTRVIQKDSVYRVYIKDKQDGSMSSTNYVGLHALRPDNGTIQAHERVTYNNTGSYFALSDDAGSTWSSSDSIKLYDAYFKVAMAQTTMARGRVIRWSDWSDYRELTVFDYVEYAQTVEAGASIHIEQSKTISALSRVLRVESNNISATGDIKKTLSNSISAKGHILTENTKTLNVKSSIQRTVTIGVISGSATVDIIDGSDDVTRTGRPRAWANYSLTDTYAAITEWPDGTEKEVGLRFDNIPVPQGATITSAYIRFTASSTQTSADANAEIVGHLVSDSPQLLTYSGFDNAMLNEPTSNTVLWNDIESWNQYSTYNSPDISAIIQELVDQGTWSMNNAINLFLKYVTSAETNRREFYLFEDAAHPAPQLVLEYEMADGGLETKARISREEGNEIDTKGAILKTKEQLINGKGSIKRTFGQGFATKGRIQREEQYSVTTKARIETINSNDITVDARILRVEENTISAKMNIQASSSYELSAVADIKDTYSNDISAKINIFKPDVTRLITASGRIGRVEENTVSAKANIYSSSSNELDTVGRIKKEEDRVVDAKASIYNSDIRLIAGRGSVKKEFYSNISGKANVLRVELKDISVKAHILRIETKTIETTARIRRVEGKDILSIGRVHREEQYEVTAKGNVIKGGSENISAIGNVFKVYSNNISALGRIKNTYSYGVSAKARIEKEASNDVVTQASIQKEFEHVLLALARVLRVEENVVYAKGSIHVQQQQTLDTKARIEKEGTQFVEVKADIFRVYNYQLNSLGRVKRIESNNIDSVGRVQRTEPEQLEALARIGLITSQEISAKARILRNESNDVSSTARIQRNEFNNIESLGRVNRIEQNTIYATARISRVEARSTDVNARIQVEDIEKTVYGTANIRTTYEQTVSSGAMVKAENQRLLDARGDIKKTQEQTLDVKGRVKQVFTKSMASKAAVLRTEPKLIETKANVRSAVPRAVDVQGNIRNAVSQIVDSQANIRATLEQTLEAVGRIETTETQTILSKANIKATKSADITVFGDIKSTTTRSVEVKAEIVYERETEVSAKALIIAYGSKYIQAKGNVFVDTRKYVNAKARIVTVEVAEITNSEGLDVREVVDPTVDAVQVDSRVVKVNTVTVREN